MNFEEIFFRIGLTFLLALAYGIQRQLTLKATSFGTFTFVATGACGLAIAAIILSKKNPLPLLSAIVTGIGFLGAGALIRTGDRVSGFTSAASIWIFAIFGVLIGTGRYKIGISIYMIVWVIILIDKYLQYRGIGSYQKKMTLVTSTPFTIENFKELFNVDSIEIISMELSNGEAPEFAYKISLIWPKRGPGFNPMKILGNENIKSMIVE